MSKMKKLTMQELMDSDEEKQEEGEKKGLLGLKFMRDAVLKKREDAKAEALKLLEDLQECADKPAEEESGSEAVSDSEDAKSNGDSLERRAAREAMKELKASNTAAATSANVSAPTEEGDKVFTKEELDEAKAKLASKKITGGRATSALAGEAAVKLSGPLSVAPRSSDCDPALSGGTKVAGTTIGQKEKRTQEADHTSDEDEDEDSFREGSASCSESGSEEDSDEENEEGGTKRPKQPKLTPDEIFKSLDLPQNSYDQIRTCFATGKQEEEFVKEQEEKHKKKEDKLLEAEDADFLAGWGGWTGEGIVHKPKKRKREFTPLAEKAKRVQKFEGVDTKSMKYGVESVPHPFQSQKQYEESLRMPTGKDWNSTAVHKRKVLPRVITKAGAVIKPLQYAKHMPEKERDELMDAWTAKKPVRSKARM